MAELTKLEIDVLKLNCGMAQDSFNCWGAALGALLGPMTRGGYLKSEMFGNTLLYSTTEKGKQAISDWEAAQ